MSHSLFSAEDKAKLEALKKTLKSHSSDSQHAAVKPDQPVNLPSQKNIDKQVKQHLEKLVGKNNQNIALDSPTLNEKMGTDDIDTQTLADELLFKQAMSGVTRLKSKNTVMPDELRQQNSNHQNATKLAKQAAAQGNDDIASDLPVSDMQAMLNPVTAEAYLMFKNPSLQHRVFNQLKEGKLRWFEAVDIHGNSIDEARSAVLKVIEMAQENEHTVLKIVHGKGSSQDKQAVLKTCVNGWLRQHPDVLAFCSATPKDGGTGAVIVLIKRTQQHEKKK